MAEIVSIQFQPCNGRRLLLKLISFEAFVEISPSPEHLRLIQAKLVHVHVHC